MDRSLADASSIAEMLVFKVPALRELGGVASVLLITSASSLRILSCSSLHSSLIVVQMDFLERLGA